MRSLKVFLSVLLMGLVVSCSRSAPRPVMTAAPATPPAELKLPAVFSDNMVLQRNRPVTVWGWAAPGARVTVALAEQTRRATADGDGRWIVQLPKRDAGGPLEMTVSDGSSEIAFKNVLMGEVWVCSGQSNMEWPLNRTANPQPVIAAAQDAKLRLFTVKRRPSDEPQADVLSDARWVECTPDAATSFSAVAYYFGKELRRELDVPVGLIHTSWGGTPIEAWLSRPALETRLDSANLFARHQESVAAYEQARKKHAEAVEAAKREGKPAPQAPRGPGLAPASLYNGMVSGLIPYTMAGVIWYQGESNAGNYEAYQRQLPTMIESWRQDWGHDFSFHIVQLANFMKRQNEPTDTPWARLREAQAMTAATVKKTGLAVAIDIGDADDIHPTNKLDVGRRLALNALAIEYGKKIAYSGPAMRSARAEGERIRVYFRHAETGLVAKGEKLTGFAIAGADGQFVWADAAIDGDSVVVWNKAVPQPVAVRYAWADNPECNLYNKAGLPALPFRTDNWERK